MKENYMKEVASLLGLELNEEFDIEDFEYNPCRITESGLYDSVNLSVLGLHKILTGQCKIIRQPWIPKLGDLYYYIFGTKDSPLINKTAYIGQEFDKEKMRLGNYFRTKEEATENTERWFDYLEKEPDLSWRK